MRYTAAAATFGPDYRDPCILQISVAADDTAIDTWYIEVLNE